MSREGLPPLIRAMLEADFYPHPVTEIELIQTHISWVVLTGPCAYKLKKPHDFGFLDFSTLERREHFCHLELQLNRRLAPELYLDVLPLCRQSDGYAFGEEGEVVDYCVKMRQFGRTALMSDRIRDPDFDPGCIDTLAADIAAFHGRPPCPETLHAFGSPEQLLRHVLDNLEAGRALKETGIATLTGQLEKHSRQAIARLKPLIEERRKHGFVRECHGDLHMKNIALIDGRPVAFDCIEFSDEYRIIDTMNDIAFLSMDCDARDRPDLGFRFLSRYLEHSGDYAGLRLMNLYTSYRAGVRGKVASLLARDPAMDECEKKAQIDEARRYFLLASNYWQTQPPRLFAIGGLSGSGKSHLALQGCGPERAVIISSDATRKRLAEQHPDLALYGQTMTDMTYAAMFDAARICLAAGFPVILDATFLDPGQRNACRALGEQADVETVFFWLDMPEEELKRRIIRRAGRDISDADLQVLDMQRRRYRKPDETDLCFLDDSGRWPPVPAPA